jgi:hypothetical protein
VRLQRERRQVGPADPSWRMHDPAQETRNIAIKGWSRPNFWASWASFAPARSPRSPESSPAPPAP